MARQSSQRLCLWGGALGGGEPCAGLQGGRFDGLPTTPRIRDGVDGMFEGDVSGMPESASLSVSPPGDPIGNTTPGALELEEAAASG